jgi:hypothetical protein
MGAVERCLACEADRGRHCGLLCASHIARGSKYFRITIGHAPRPRQATAGAFRPVVPTPSASQARQRSMILSRTRHSPQSELM